MTPIEKANQRILMRMAGARRMPATEGSEIDPSNPGSMATSRSNDAEHSGPGSNTGSSPVLPRAVPQLRLVRSAT